MSEEGDPLAQTSLQQGQNVRKDRVDVIAVAVHQLTQKIQFLTAGLELHQLTQPVRSPNMHRSEELGYNHLRQLSRMTSRGTLLEHVVTSPYHGFGGHQEAMETIHSGVVPELHRYGSFVLHLFVGAGGHVSAHVEVS